MKRERNILTAFIVFLLLSLMFASCASTSEKGSVREYFDDSLITAKVKSKLAGNEFFKSFQVGVETNNGVVQLSGSASSHSAIDKAVEIARSVQGVKSVINKLTVEYK